VTAREDAGLVRMTASLHRRTRHHLAQVIGQTPVPLHSYFGFLAPSPALALVAAAKSDVLTRLIDLPADAPLISSVAPAKMGGRSGPRNYVDIPAGPLSLRHIFDLAFFPNRLAAVRVTGAQLMDWIEMSSGFYNQITPGAQDQTLVNPDRPAYGSDLFYGVCYEIDLSQPARFDSDGYLTHPGHRRVTSLSFQGRAVRPDDAFTVALSSFRANGGGNVEALKTAQRLHVPHILVRDALKDYVQRGLFPDLAYDMSCRFRSFDDTSVFAQTGPGAAAFLDEIEAMRLDDGRLDAQGFLQLRLQL